MRSAANFAVVLQRLLQHVDILLSRLLAVPSGGLGFPPRGLPFGPVLGPGVERSPSVDRECRRETWGATAASLGLDLGTAVSRFGSGSAVGVAATASLPRALVDMMVHTRGLRGAV